MKKKLKTYSELRRLKTFDERFDYLKLIGKVGYETFGVDRVFNQMFYKSKEWKHIRNKIIIRDDGCDLGIKGQDICGSIIIHHMNPITLKDINENIEYVLNPEYLICTSHQTHNAIHYGDKDLIKMDKNIERKPGDTKLW